MLGWPAQKQEAAGMDELLLPLQSCISLQHPQLEDLTGRQLAKQKSVFQSSSPCITNLECRRESLELS